MPGLTTKTMKNEFWEFRAQANKKSAELLLYGRVASEKPWWCPEGEDNYILAKQFAKDLKALGDIDNLDIYLNSPGGDVFAGQAISSVLQRHKSYKTCYIDGLAASIAVNIVQVCDKRVIPKNAMMMVHQPWQTVFGGYNALELRKMADGLDRIAESTIALFLDKTALTREEIVTLMDDETWMTAEEAVEFGFADEVEQSKEVAACVQGDLVMLGGLSFGASLFKHFPVDKLQVSKTKTEKEEESMELNQEILAKDYPEIFNAVKKLGSQEGAAAERSRMQAIDDLATPGSEKLVNQAKYETGVSAAELALQLVKAEKDQSAQYLAGAKDDSQPMAGVKGTTPNPGQDATKKQSWIQAFAKGANQKRGGK